jgi:hypothetical protein
VVAATRYVTASHARLEAYEKRQLFRRFIASRRSRASALKSRREDRLRAGVWTRRESMVHGAQILLLR